ncbi:MAG: hypothetical protein ACOYK9_01585 [Chlamydiia bacterium]
MTSFLFLFEDHDLIHEAVPKVFNKSTYCLFIYYSLGDYLHGFKLLLSFFWL